MTIGNGISFSGLASGLDTSAIINQLVALERLPIDALEASQRETRSKIALVDTFGSLVKDLKEHAETLSKRSSFFAFNISTSHEGIANAEVTGSAEAGSHSVKVLQTAAVDRWAFGGVTDLDTELAGADGQVVSFDVAGETFTIAVDQAESTLSAILNAVEAAAGEHVDGSIVNSGTDESPAYQLVLSSRRSGADFTITNLSTNITGLNTGVENVTEGRNAQAEIDGLTISRSDNDFSGVIEGVSLDLVSASTTEMTISIEADREVAKTQIEEFIAAYNAVVEFTNKQNTYTEDGGAGGLLIGDSLLSGVRRSLSNAIDVPIDTVLGDTEGYSTLSLVGIARQSNGTLQINETTFNEKLEGNLEAMAALFVDSDGFDNGGAAPDDADALVDYSADDGLADNLVRAIDRMFGTFQGSVRDQSTGDRLTIDSVFKARNEALESNLSRFAKQIEAKELRLESFRALQVRRFAALEEAIAGLNAQGSALNSALSQF